MENFLNRNQNEKSSDKVIMWLQFVSLVSVFAEYRKQPVRVRFHNRYR